MNEIDAIRELHRVAFDYEDDKVILACMLGVDALKKQMPVKPAILRIENEAGEDEVYYHCPACAYKLGKGQRCGNNDCGQAIDWSGVE